MRIGRLFVPPALLLLASPVSGAEPPWPSGLYSNVKMSAETGDLGGMEARFFEEAGEHKVEFVWCEGWCNETFTVPVTRADGGFAFSYFQRFADGGAEAGVTMRFLARPAGRGLTISAWQGDQKLDYDGKPQLLRRAREPFGIAVANGGKQ